MHHATFTESFRRIRAHEAAAELPVTEQVTRAGDPELRRLARTCFRCPVIARPANSRRQACGPAAPPRTWPRDAPAPGHPGQARAGPLGRLSSARLPRALAFGCTK